VSKKSLNLAVICPFLNEEGNLTTVINQIILFIRDHGSISRARVILIDDGSTDNSLSVIKRLLLDLGFKRTVSYNYPLSSNDYYNGILNVPVLNRQKKLEVIVLKSSSNRGQSVSVRLGLQFAEDAEWSMIIDSDGQHTANLMNALWELRSDVLIVNSKQKFRRDSKAKIILTYLYYFALRKLNNPNSQEITGEGEFRLIKEQVVQAINRFPLDISVRNLIPKFSVAQNIFFYEPAVRLNGKTKYSLRQMFRLAFQTNSTSLQLFEGIAIALSWFWIFLIFLYVGFVFFTWTTSQAIPGWTSLILLISFGNLGLTILSLLTLMSVRKIRDVLEHQNSRLS
jgi:glycosyltransferase involved in cell wall biosynthesis